MRATLGAVGLYVSKTNYFADLLAPEPSQPLLDLAADFPADFARIADRQSPDRLFRYPAFLGDVMQRKAARHQLLDLDGETLLDGR